MQKIMALLAALVRFSSQNNEPDIDCTSTLDRFYPDAHEAMLDIDHVKKLQYVFQNHRHFFYATFTSNDLLRYELSLHARSRIVVTFEINGARFSEALISHSCHIFTDNF